MTKFASLFKYDISHSTEKQISTGLIKRKLKKMLKIKKIIVFVLLIQKHLNNDQFHFCLNQCLDRLYLVYH